MGKKIAWVTDTAALLDEKFIQDNQIHVLPLNIVFEEGALRETVDMTHDQFYEKLRNAKKNPKTSQPTIGEVVDLYKSLKEQGYTCAIAIHTSQHLSGTYQSTFTAAGQAEFEVYPVDSKIGSFPMMKMIKLGQQLEREGFEPGYIVERINEMADNSELSFIPANLSQLHKSGRVSGTQAFLSNLLNIKVVISFEDGKPVMKEKVRATTRAKTYVQNVLNTDLEKSIIPEVAIIHCNDEEGATAWKKALENEYPHINFSVLPLSACVAVHAGEGTLGLSWVRLTEFAPLKKKKAELVTI
ncbi:DegV family protein [Lysinibacillus sp. NPDC086135]|uniref:DegV family protein n=1 Tax=Lysinibacillus sp. NPDC086135 TaxID=3364130 RepID=UPI00380FF133